MALTERFALMLEPQMIEQIDDYRHANRIGTRAETMRELVAKGLEKMATAGASLATEPAEAGDRNTHKERCNAAST